MAYDEQLIDAVWQQARALPDADPSATQTAPGRERIEPGNTSV